MQSVYTDKHKLRDAKTELYGGTLVPPFECPVRAEYVLARLKEVELGAVHEPDEFGLERILRVHDSAFIDFLQNCWEQWAAEGMQGEAIPTVWPGRSMPQSRVPDHIEGKMGYYCLANETSISDGTWEAAKASANVALTAQAKIAGGESSAFALCRPPGHHAATDAYGGYCFINNAAVCAQTFIDQGAQRVAILDVDFHHGNGTQEIFYQREDVMFCSLHGDPRDAFPHFLGYADESGAGAGEGFNHNYPMGPGTPYSKWSKSLDDALAKIAQYAPDVLIISLGVDTFENDPISFFKLKSDDFSDYGARIAKLGLPTLFIMEGGYAVEEIGINAVNVLTGFEGA
ncbi:MAG: histone deacetylase family protein [Pseudomonadota bacterium]